MATCKEEFRCVSFSLGGTEPSLFATPQARWLGAPWTFILYRSAMAIYQFVMFILVLVHWGEEPLYSVADNKAKWLIYVSNWTFLTVTIYFIMAAVTTIYWQMTHRQSVDEKVNQSSKGDIELNANNPTAATNGGSSAEITDAPAPSTPWYFQLQRFFHVFACSASAFVTILFWVLEFDPETSLAHVFNVHVHGVALFLMIVDTFLVATPFRIVHMVYVSLTAFLYFCFTAIYNAAGGLNPSGESHIYDGYLDWRSAPGTSAVVAAITVFVAAPVLHLIFYAFYRLRLTFVKCCSCCAHQ